MIEDAFQRERQIKAGSRKKKIELITKMNPTWQDLFPSLISGEIEELRKIKKHFK